MPRARRPRPPHPLLLPSRAGHTARSARDQARRRRGQAAVARRVKAPAPAGWVSCCVRHVALAGLSACHARHAGAAVMILYPMPDRIENALPGLVIAALPNRSIERPQEGASPACPSRSCVMAAARRASCAPFRARAAQGSVVAWTAGLACSGWLAHRCHGVLFFEHGWGPGRGSHGVECFRCSLCCPSAHVQPPVASRLRGTSRRGGGCRGPGAVRSFSPA